MAMSSERRLKTLEEPLNLPQLEKAGENVLERFRQDIRREVGLDMEFFENRMRTLMGTPLPHWIPSFVEDRIAPPVDVEETKSTYLVRANLPGVPKEKVEIHFWGQNLDLKAEMESVKETERKNYVYRERTEAGYHRRLSFPTLVVPEKVEAVLENGILTVTVPKLEPAKEQRIRVR